MLWLFLACVHSPMHTDLDVDLPEESVEGVLVHPRDVADPALASILQRATEDHQAWIKLAELCDDIGARLSGTPALAKAVRWAVTQLADAGVDEVHTEEVMVPVWIRGEESLEMTAPRAQSLQLLGLGGSVGARDVEAPVFLARSFEDLGPEVAGKIVVYNVPMLDGEPTVQRYGPAVQYRVHGASRAAEHGAVAALVRSVTTRSLDTPHTGGLRYDEAHPQIPSASITTENAAHIARLVDRGIEVRLRLRMGATTKPDVKSHNVIAEIKGRKFPEEIVLIGAHLDSWDVGQGAHDDGAGVVEVIEAMRVIQSLGPKPKRTIRAVLFTNEENGLRGGLGYAEAHPDSDSERHIAAIESDLGGGRPIAWGASGDKKDLQWLREHAAPLGLPVNEGGGGADISPLADRGTLLIGLRPDDTHYFDVHHTNADTVDKVDANSLAQGTAALAGLAWVLANADR
jgi:carboxypeptidase Q